MIRVAHRDVQFVRSDNAKLRISKLPPELMSDDRNVESRWGFRSILNRKDDSSRCQKKDDYDNYWNHCPCKLNLITPVDLRRFARVVLLAGTETKNHENKESGNDREDGTCDAEYEYS